MTKRKAPKQGKAIWDLPPGYFTEPAVAWFGSKWRPRLSDPSDKLYHGPTAHRMAAASVANREKGLQEGAWWAVGYLGQLSAGSVPAVDIATSRVKVLTGLRPRVTK